MTDLERMLENIMDNPEDSTLMLIYSDCLLDHNQESEAGFWKWVGEKRRCPLRDEMSYNQETHCVFWWYEDMPLENSQAHIRSLLPTSIFQYMTDAQNDKGKVTPCLIYYSMEEVWEHLEQAWNSLNEEEKKLCWEWVPPSLSEYIGIFCND